jgi:flagellar motor switch protein FliM
MGDTLTGEEIDALLKGMADGQLGLGDAAPSTSEARPLSLIADRGDSARRFPALAVVNERFVRELGRVLGMLFDVGVALDRREPFALDFGSLRNRLVPRAVLGLFSMAPLAGEGLIMLPPALGFEMVDRLFGGPGLVPPDVSERELSPISVRTVEGIAAKIVEAFAAAWGPLLRVECRFLRTEPNPMLVEIAGADDTVIGFEVHCDLGRGRSPIWVVVPQPALESARAKLQESKGSSRRIDPAWLGAMTAAIEQMDVVVSADLGHLELSAREVLALRAGDVLHLPTRGEDALAVHVEGTPLLAGLAGVSRGRNAVRVVGFEATTLGMGG